MADGHIVSLWAVPLPRNSEIRGDERPCWHFSGCKVSLLVVEHHRTPELFVMQEVFDELRCALAHQVGCGKDCDCKNARRHDGRSYLTEVQWIGDKDGGCDPITIL